MTLFILFVYVLLAYGTTNIILYFDGPFKIVEYFRRFMTKLSSQFAELVRCQACCSTWVGILLSGVNMLATPSIPFTPFNLLLGSTGLWWLILILDSLFTSGVVWLLFRLEDKLTASEEEEKNG